MSGAYAGRSKPPSAGANLDPDLYNPWYFPEPDEYRVRLENASVSRYATSA